MLSIRADSLARAESRRRERRRAAIGELHAAQRIQELETTLHAAEWRNRELARNLDLSNAENDRLRDELSVMKTEYTTLRLKLAGVIPADE